MGRPLGLGLLRPAGQFPAMHDLVEGCSGTASARPRGVRARRVSACRHRRVGLKGYRRGAHLRYKGVHRCVTKPTETGRGRATSLRRLRGADCCRLLRGCATGLLRLCGADGRALSPDPVPRVRALSMASGHIAARIGPAGTSQVLTPRPIRRLTNDIHVPTSLVGSDDDLRSALRGLRELCIACIHSHRREQSADRLHGSRIPGRPTVLAPR